MNRKYTIKLIKYHKNLFHIVVGLNKTSLHSYYFEKIGVGFTLKNKKIIMIKMKNLFYWLNKGVKLQGFISYMSSLLFFSYLKNNKKLLLNLKKKF